MNSLQQFSLIEKEKKFSEAAVLIEWCPTMDLIALVTNTNDLLLYRYRGQRVWALRTREIKGNVGQITTISWKPDGQVLAIGFSTGSISLCNVQEGKIVHSLSLNTPFSPIRCLAWNEQMFQTERIPPIKPGSNPPESVIGYLPELPKLLNIRTTGTFYHFNTNQSKEDSGELDSLLNVLLVVDAGGNLVICLDGTYMLGILEKYIFPMPHEVISNLPLFSPNIQNIYFVKHACSPDQSLQAILAVDDSSSLRLSYQHIAFLDDTPSQLLRITKISTRITGIVAYIREAVKNMQAEWKVAFDLTQKHIKQFQSSLIAHRVGDSVTPTPELFQLLLTGIPSAPTRDWLLTDLTERGLKAWEKTLNTAYDHLRNLTHDNILLACDHLSVLLSELKGAVKWANYKNDFTLGIDTIDGPISALKELYHESHKFLLELNKEVEAFRNFTIWLRIVFDDVQQIENSEIAPEFNPSEVVSYLRDRFNDSPLDLFLCQKTTENAVVESSLSELVSKLSASCQAIYEVPAKNVCQRISSTESIDILSRGGDYHFDVRVWENIIVAFSSRTEKTCLYLVKIEFPRKGLEKPEGIVSGVAIDLRKDEERLQTQDFCFEDIETLLILLSNCKDTDPYTMLSCVTLDDFNFIPLGPLRDNTRIGELVMNNAPIVSPSWNRKREFVKSFQPCKLAVNGNVGRRIGCMLAQDGQTHVIFDLDADDEEEINNQGYT
ncbi:Anaphase-promoting complex subunit 4 [Neolecta irregularis DAH-3]|uniref:Anaphase-promoting complex subunit 4 n=1 Tax=Neolecta irregularis (strain DAH-3) TaxID=1198029 RepID=A0A1U7LNM9_NEOID|nr:Anaphase-promoting complex subunit 4 [Neolecta irregularis DAH-3]|eukprot:OLL24257.1 Anaphase-promoting complex subunit 4 [Neolecta irregularis DAH-3]